MPSWAADVREARCRDKIVEKVSEAGLEWGRRRGRHYQPMISRKVVFHGLGFPAHYNLRYSKEGGVRKAEGD